MKYSSVFNKIALGAILASSVAMFASNPLRTKTETPTQTEVVSKDGADALKALTFPQQKQNPAVPTVHNQKLDEKFLKLADNDEEKSFMEDFLSNLYKNNGSYLASVTIQQNIDLNMFLAFLDGNIDILKNFEGEYRVTSNSSSLGSYYDVAKKYYTPEVKAQLEDLKQKIGDWVSENYLTIYSNTFNCDHSPDYEETQQMFNKLFSSLDDYEFSPGRKMFANINPDYVNSVLLENMNNSTLNETQKKMNLFANMIYKTDNDLFWNLSKLFYDPPSNKKLYWLYGVFMQAAKPENN